MRILEWTSMPEAERRAALARPAQRDAARIAREVKEIIEAVRAGGDAALRDLTERFDGVRLTDLAVGEQEFADAERTLDSAQHRALDTAIETVRKFHAAQSPAPLRVETAPGVVCERISVPVRAVGLYVPAGSAPLPSTAVMLAVPAAIAGCPLRIMCTAPNRRGGADPAVLVAARKAGIGRVFKVGGAQAIAAMAYGTASIPKCDKLFGPGNAWVTTAKLLAANDAAGAAADLPAGVTEVMVIADRNARAEFVASDLLAQAEHGVDAQAILVTPSAALAQAVALEVARQAPSLSRAEILSDLDAGDAPRRGRFARDGICRRQRIRARAPAPANSQPSTWLPRVQAAGAVFLGSWSPESMGDYCSGTESHAADLRLCAGVQRAVARGFPSASPCRSSRRRA